MVRVFPCTKGKLGDAYLSHTVTKRAQHFKWRNMTNMSENKKGKSRKIVRGQGCLTRISRRLLFYYSKWDTV